jgi:hypothetical protein
VDLLRRAHRSSNPRCPSTRVAKAGSDAPSNSTHRILKGLIRAAVAAIKPAVSGQPSPMAWFFARAEPHQQDITPPSSNPGAHVLRSADLGLLRLRGSHSEVAELQRVLEGAPAYAYARSIAGLPVGPTDARSTF